MLHGGPAHTSTPMDSCTPHSPACSMVARLTPLHQWKVALHTHQHAPWWPCSHSTPMDSCTPHSPACSMVAQLTPLHQWKAALHTHQHAPWWPGHTSTPMDSCTPHSPACSMVARLAPLHQWIAALHTHQHAPWWPGSHLYTNGKLHSTLTSMLHGGPAHTSTSMENCTPYSPACSMVARLTPLHQWIAALHTHQHAPWWPGSHLYTNG